MIFEQVASTDGLLRAFGEPQTLVVVRGDQAYFRRTIERNQVAHRHGWKYVAPLKSGNLEFYSLRWVGNGSIAAELRKI